MEPTRGAPKMDLDTLHNIDVKRIADEFLVSEEGKEYMRYLRLWPNFPYSEEELREFPERFDGLHILQGVAPRVRWQKQ